MIPKAYFAKFVIFVTLNFLAVDRFFYRREYAIFLYCRNLFGFDHDPFVPANHMEINSFNIRLSHKLVIKNAVALSNDTFIDSLILSSHFQFFMFNNVRNHHTDNFLSNFIIFLREFNIIHAALLNN